MEYLEAEPLTIYNHTYMYPNEIIIKIPKSLKGEIEEIKRKLEEYNNENLPKEWEDGNSFIIHFDNHLYTPLIVWKEGKEEVKSIPVKLNKGETKFVEDLKRFLQGKNPCLASMTYFY